MSTESLATSDTMMLSTSESESTMRAKPLASTSYQTSTRESTTTGGDLNEGGGTTALSYTDSMSTTTGDMQELTLDPVTTYAYYSFEGDTTDSSGNNRDGTTTGDVSYTAGQCGRAASFDGASKISVQSFANFAWGTEFSVSVWFKRTGRWHDYQGIVNNGYSDTGSWEIRMGHEDSGQMLGGGVITTTSGSTWDYVYLVAPPNTWNHVVMTYDGSVLLYYLNGQQQTVTNQNCCTGPILTRNTPVTIGQAGPGHNNEYFYGLIDEVKIFGRVLTAVEVQNMADHPCL